MKISGTAENYKICNATCHIYKVNVLASIFNEIEGISEAHMANADEQYHQRSTRRSIPLVQRRRRTNRKIIHSPHKPPKVGISDDDLKNRVSLRVSAPGYTYPWYRWVIPMLGETTAGIGAIGIPVVVGTFINHQIAGHTADAWLLFWVVVVSIGFIALNEYFGWGASMKFGAELDRDWRTILTPAQPRSA